MPELAAPPTDSSDALNDLPLGPVSVVTADAELQDVIRQARRRADIDTRQEKLGRLLEEMGCEGVVLLVPAHVHWFTGGLNVRGLFAESERPGIYTNGRQRWLLCSVTDTQRLFDEELDGLGFQLKEWQWGSGRPALLAELVVGKKFAVDRPFPNLPMINERLRFDLRTLSDLEQDDYRKLGKRVAHAVEATARTMPQGIAEEEIAGQVAHRLYHRGVDLVSISITADDRGAKYRRSGFTNAAVGQTCTLQATGTRGGLFSTASRTVCFGKCPDAFRTEFDNACKVSAIFRSLSTVGETMATAAEAARRLLSHTANEFDGRLSQPGYGTGRVAAEELRRTGIDEKFAAGWSLVWQSRVGAAAVVDTLTVTETTPIAVTPPEDWPFKRITVKGHGFEVPDVLMREV
jgi:hypothetical protein